jgi:hypothetical protein
MDFKTPDRILMTVMIIRGLRLVTYTGRDGSSKEAYVATCMQVHPVTMQFVDSTMLEIFVSTTIGRQLRKDHIYDVVAEKNIANVTGSINKETGIASLHEKDSLNSNLWTPVNGATIKGEDVKPIGIADRIEDAIAAEVDDDVNPPVDTAKATKAKLVMQD